MNHFKNLSLHQKASRTSTNKKSQKDSLKTISVFWRWCRGLQNKSEEEKRRIMWTLVIVFGVIVFLIWLLFLPQSFRRKEKKESDELEKAALEFKNKMSEYNFGQVLDSFKKIKNKKGIEEEKMVEKPRLPLESKEQENTRTKEQK